MGEADQSYVNASESVLHGEDTGESANMIKAINLLSTKSADAL